MHPSTGTLAPAVIRSVVLIALIAACSPSPEPKGPPAPPPGPRSCGTETLRLDSGYDAAARGCIWDAYKAHDPAQFTTTRYTIEGDPITYTITITRLGIDVVVNSKDRLGQHGVFKHSCRNFERIMQEERKDRFGFALSGCTGGGTDRLAVP
jgi:hypothetical protein